MELTVESLFSTGGLVGNLSYILLIVSMSMRDIFWLRIIAIFSGLTGIAYDVVWLNDPVGAFWETAFTLVNIVQWLWLVRERRGGLLNTEEELLRKLLFPSLSKTSFRKFLQHGTRQEVTAQTQLTRQGEAVTQLLLIADGLADIHVNEELVATCRIGDLVGEISFLTKGTATATVTARTAMVFFAFDKSSLSELLDKSEELNTAFSAMCNANLANKLVRTTEGTIG